METRASFELHRMLGSGEVIEKLEMSWDELVHHGDEPFDLYFPPVRGVHPFFTLKVALVHTCNNKNDVPFNSLVNYGIARDTDAGHAQFAAYITSENISHLNDAVEHFRLVLDQCPVGYPDYAAALTNLASARLDGYIQNDIDTTTSLLRNALALRPQRHSHHPSSLYNLALALSLCYNEKGTIADICEAGQLCHDLLPLCKGYPPLYEDLQAAARQGPAIILNASKYSCSAIIVPTSGDPHHVPLPSVALADLTNLKDRFARAIRDSSRMNPGESRTDLIVLLRIIWDQIMLPIVHVLEHVLKLKRRSRIWLCPTAAFTSIALHAAHPFQTKADRSVKEQCLEDLYICSYTPTLSALVRSRQSMKKRVPPSFVVIGQGQPGSGTGKALLAVDSELELQNTWVHLACHGKQDPMQPYSSHLFVFLSACHTAVGDEETPDEVIHLAAGLRFSGFKSVIGTLWEVDNAVAKHIVEAFYTYMFRDSKDGGVVDCTKAA
ncbi:uncharacterized protein F5147DRAFT_835365 [Suillus discolor]|uniref:CHAT domain-containing protein n=1 Tax=Suillus discolor TaxID=1912936 RepID=A0A9P7FAU1_9AGAM|nr:uncharacterized protein F5147DRAFT_835365 [Suillus discolor]KAG2112632.1 hypothetical protein F5147DRAFT_835365 [Suillus discolor]